MNCFYCDQPLKSGHVRNETWGQRMVLAHKPSCERQDLLNQAYALGVFTAAEDRTDQELIDAITAEKLSGEFLDRLEKLPEAAQAAAIHRLGKML